jgi:hypothetical protein
VWQHLHHPFILPFIGLAHPATKMHVLPYMVSELAPRGTLEAFVASSDFVPEDDSLRLVRTRN